MQDLQSLWLYSSVAGRKGVKRAHKRTNCLLSVHGPFLWRHFFLAVSAMACSRWTAVAREICKSNNCQLLQSSKDTVTCDNKLEGIGPLPLSMVSLKRTGGEWTGNTTRMAGHEWCFPRDFKLQPSRSGKCFICFLNRFYWTGQSNERKYCCYAIHVLESGLLVDILFIPL